MVMNEHPSESQTPTLVKLDSSLSLHPTFKYIRFHIVDYGNVPRARLVTIQRAREIAANPEETSAMSTASVMLDLNINLGASMLDLPNLEEDHWVPDEDTLRPVAMEPAHAVYGRNQRV
jgi:hypothetical protein